MDQFHWTTAPSHQIDRLQLIQMGERSRPPDRLLSRLNNGGTCSYWHQDSIVTDWNITCSDCTLTHEKKYNEMKMSHIFSTYLMKLMYCSDFLQFWVESTWLHALTVSFLLWKKHHNFNLKTEEVNSTVSYALWFFFPGNSIINTSSIKDRDFNPRCLSDQ